MFKFFCNFFPKLFMIIVSTVVLIWRENKGYLRGITPSWLVQVTVQSRKGEIGNGCRGSWWQWESEGSQGCRAEISPHIRKLAYTDAASRFCRWESARVLVYTRCSHRHTDIYTRTQKSPVYSTKGEARSFREPAGRTGEQKVLSWMVLGRI